MASGALVDPQSTVIGPPNSRADPNQKIARRVVRPTRSVTVEVGLQLKLTNVPQSDVAVPTSNSQLQHGKGY